MPGFLAPIGNGQQWFTNAGFILSGGKINTYLAGTTTPQSTWTDSTQVVTNANPIVLDSAGRSPQEIWLAASTKYKFVVTDANNVTIGTFDNLSGVNDATFSQAEWVSSGLTPAFINATQFSVGGNQTSLMQVNRRVQCTVTAGTVYGYISASSFAASITTVTVVLDSGVLDSGLNQVNVGFLAANNPSLPRPVTYASDTGAANAYVVSGITQGPNSLPVTTYAQVTGILIGVKPVSANTAASTLQVNGITPVANIFLGGAALVGGEISPNVPFLVVYDGTQFNIIGRERIPVLRILTVSTTYTKPAGLTAAMVEVVGGGGGSGGAVATTAGQSSAGSGGGGGGYSKRLLAASVIGATETVTIGAGGTAGSGAASNSTAGTGGSTSFGTSVTATGGSGGISEFATTATVFHNDGRAPGSGTSPGAAINLNGGYGGGVLLVGGSSAQGGTGGTTVFAQSVHTFSGGGAAPGVAGSVGGGGASGPINVNAQVAQDGMAGGAGLVIITEFY